MIDQYQNVLITGGAEGIGHDLISHINSNVTSVTSLSRRNGFNINVKEDRAKIVEKSVDCDLFINLAHSTGTFAQAKLLYELHRKWAEIKKEGVIINIGSYKTYSPGFTYRSYTSHKMMLDEANRQCCKEIENKDLPFRMFNLKLAILDTKKSRNKDYWPGCGLTGEDIYKTILSLVNTPEHLIIPEVVLTFKQRN